MAWISFSDIISRLSEDVCLNFRDLRYCIMLSVLLVRLLLFFIHRNYDFVRMSYLIQFGSKRTDYGIRGDRVLRLESSFTSTCGEMSSEYIPLCRLASV